MAVDIGGFLAPYLVGPCGGHYRVGHVGEVRLGWVTRKEDELGCKHLSRMVTDGTPRVFREGWGGEVAECEGGADLGGEVAMGQVCGGYEGGREESMVVPGKISMGTVVRGKAPTGVSLRGAC